MGEDANTQISHGNDIGRGTSGAVAAASNDFDQSWVARVANNTHSQGSADEEDAKTDIDHLERSLDVDSGAFGLGGDHGDVLGTDNSEGSRGETGEEALESPQTTRTDVFAECATVLPVAETVRIVLGISTHHGDEGEEEEGEDQDDLAAREPELGLTVRSHGQDVDGAIGDKLAQCSFSREVFAFRTTYA